MALIKEKLRGGSMRLVAYEANQWISQLFVKVKGRIDPSTVKFLTDLRSLNNAIAYPDHWNEQMPTLKADAPQWAEYYAAGDVSNAFEGMITMEGQEQLLTVAPPVRLNADSFTDEGLRSYGMKEEEIQALQMIGCCSGLECHRDWQVQHYSGMSISQMGSTD